MADTRQTDKPSASVSLLSAEIDHAWGAAREDRFGKPPAPCGAGDVKQIPSLKDHAGAGSS